MAFIDINKFLTLSNNKDRPRIGVVIDNADPSYRGRVKVKLQGMFDPTDEKGSNLPWIRQDGRSFNGVEQFLVPDIGSPVELVWKFGSRFPTYKPAPHESNSYSTQFLDSYPNSWGWADNGGFLFRINKLSNEFVLKTKAFTLTVDPLGSFILTNNGSTISSDSSGNITINGGNVTISGTTTIEGKKFLEHCHSNGHEGANTGGVV